MAVGKVNKKKKSDRERVMTFTPRHAGFGLDSLLASDTPFAVLSREALLATSAIQCTVYKKDKTPLRL